jgi:predicted transcriptional regulator
MYIKKSKIRIIKKVELMKQELSVNMRVVKDHGANAAVVLAVIKDAYGLMSVTQVANAVGITYPTAHKCLDILAGENLIKAKDKLYGKL